MRVKIVGPASTGHPGIQPLISYLINDEIAVDAGCLGCITPLSSQRKIKHVLLTHAHQDHIASLPIFLDIVHRPESECVTIYGNEHTLQALRRHIFNDHIWPNLERLSIAGRPFVRFEQVDPQRSFTIASHRITPVALNHTIPTVGYIVQETTAASSAIAVISDTGPTDEIWKRLKRIRNLKAVLLEASFPDSLAELATITGHLTPSTFEREVAKLLPGVRVLAVHLKPAYAKQISREISQLQLSNVEVGRVGKWYRF
ncbi:MAG: MBL fold metallo-hydrolase [Planctomycetaceae bacterium]